jgi:hypothetical protein
MNKELHQTIVESLGLTLVSKEKQEEVIGELGGLILQLVLVKATERMSDETLISFEGVLALQNSDEIMGFLEKTIPDFDALVAEASREIVEEYKKGLS